MEAHDWSWVDLHGMLAENVAIAPDSSFALVSAFDAIVRIDLKSGNVSEHYDFTVQGMLSVHACAISKSGDFALVTDDNHVGRFCLLTKSLTFPLAQNHFEPGRVALSHDDSFALFLNAGRVARIDLSNWAVEFPYEDSINEAISSLDAGPMIDFTDVDIAPDGSFALLGIELGMSDMVARLDLTSRAVSLYKCPLVVNSIAISANGAFALLACCTGPLVHLDLTSGGMQYPFTTWWDSEGHRDIALSRDNSFALVVHDRGKVVERVNVQAAMPSIRLLAASARLVEGSLQADLAALTESGDDGDICIKVGESCLRAHSIILKARSPVFKAMLQSPMREALSREIKVEETDSITMRLFLKYMHTDWIEASVFRDSNQTLQLFQVADRYEVKALAQICAEALKTRGLHVECVIDIFLVANRLSYSGLRQACLAFIKEHIADVQDSEGYRLLVQRQPGLLADIIAALTPPNKRRRLE
eukprot:TRINITY_DN109014_c0_g1_i1.p1 TRINITY_DN109014_c0_g1~~TRINITY_DN109014_c0_g1_i1.p1  ORF type:complete len:475 (-),score=52.19 TRINITY_DN109014_c0_g1_i1:58-1482(-)